MIGHRARTGLAVVLVGLGSCGRFGFAPTPGSTPDTGPDGSPTDTARDGSGPPSRQCIPLTGAWSLETPVLVPGLNAPELDCEATLSPDGLTLYFASDRGTAGWDSYRASRTDLTGDFGPPAPQTAINSETDELRFLLAPDGLTAYLNADWTGGAGKSDIWVATRQSTATPFAQAMFSLVQGVNTVANEYDPWVSPDGLRLFFFRASATSEDIWLAERGSSSAPFSAVGPLPGVNSQGLEDNPTLTADELLLVFSSDRPDGVGGKDLWYAVRTNQAEQFSQPQPLPVVNTAGSEGEPWIHPATCELFFSSSRKGGPGSLDIYRSRFIPK